MPYVHDLNLDDQENQQNDPTQTHISGASPTTEKDGQVQDASSGPAPKSSGSGYQNLDKYLQNNDAQAFGQQVAGKVQGEVDQAKDQMSGAGKQFEDQVNNSYTPPSNLQVDNAISAVTNPNPAPSPGLKSSNSPNGYSSQEVKQPQAQNPANPDDAAKTYQSWINASYTGPNNLASSPDLYNQYWSGAQKANTSAQLLGTEPGRFTLLDSYFGRPGYSFGQKSLDNLLVQRSGIGRQTNDLQNQTAQLEAQGNQQQQNLASEASRKAGQVEDSASYARSAIGVDAQGNVITDPTASGYGALGKAYSGVKGEVSTANTDRAARLAQVKKDLQSGTITQAEATALGLTDGQNLYTLDPNQYLTAGADLSNNQVMTGDEQRKIQALSQLAGVTDTFANGEIGGAAPAYTYNGGKLGEDSRAVEDKYKADLTAAYAKVSEKGPNGLTPDVYTPEYMQGLIAANKQSIAEDPGSGNNPERQAFIDELQAALDQKTRIDAIYNPGRKLTVKG